MVTEWGPILEGPIEFLIHAGDHTFLLRPLPAVGGLQVMHFHRVVVNWLPEYEAFEWEDQLSTYSLSPVVPGNMLLVRGNRMARGLKHHHLSLWKST